jgi:hypothetical protein
MMDYLFDEPLHRQIVSRARLFGDLGNNLFRASESLEKIVSEDYPFEALRHHLHDYFAGILVLFEPDDKIDDRIAGSVRLTEKKERFSAPYGLVMQPCVTEGHNVKLDS